MLRGIAAMFALSISVFAPAQQETTQPTIPPPTTDAAVEQLRATITAVKGLVQVRQSEADAWQKAEVGMEVGESAEFRTGPRSAVQFHIAPDHTITLDRLGTVKLLQAVNDNGIVKTDVGMKYGRTRYDIETGGREHESAIHSPSSTLAVRGTRFSLYEQRPFAVQATSLQGTVQYRDAKKQLKFGRRNAGKTVVKGDKNNAAETSLEQAVVDPSIAFARTEAEEELIASLVSRGSVLAFDREVGIPVVRGGRPLSNRELIPVLPGDLNFVLRWDGPADLNLGVSSPESAKGESIFPLANLTESPSGGRTAFDHRGGPNGGMEIIYWPGSFPEGFFSMGVQHISGDQPVTARLEAFEGGQRIPLTNFTNGMVHSIRATVEPGGTTAALVPVGVPPPFEGRATAGPHAKGSERDPLKSRKTMNVNTGPKPR